MRKKILFIDRDGTIIREPETDFQVDELSKFCFFPGVIGALRKIAGENRLSFGIGDESGRFGNRSLSRRNFLAFTTIDGKNPGGRRHCLR